MHPMGWPARSLKFATDFRARRTTGFWPVIAASSSTAESMIFQAEVDHPLRQGGHLVDVRVAELLLQPGMHFLAIALQQSGHHLTAPPAQGR